MRKLLIVLVVLLLLLCVQVMAFRIPRPPKFSIPWTQDQVNQLNDSLEWIWNLQNGEFNFDIVTTTKSNAGNGDMWILTGATAQIQIKVNGNIYTFNPD